MPEDQAPAGRRATWVALRTLHQRPTVVGRTDDGETVYDVRSVELVLAEGAAHSRRLVQCAKCGRDMVGPPVLAADDLDRPANPMFCGRCVVTSAPAPSPPPAPPARPAPQTPRPAGGSPPPASVGRPPVRAAVDADVAELRGAVAEAQAELRRLAGAQRECVRIVAELRDRVDQRPAVEGLERRFAEVHSETAALVTAQRRALLEALERLRAEAESLRQRVDDLEHARFAAAEEVESRLDALAAAADAGASRDRALGQKLKECIDRISLMYDGGASDASDATPRAAPGGLLESLERQLREAEERIAQR